MIGLLALFLNLLMYYVFHLHSLEIVIELLRYILQTNLKNNCSFNHLTTLRITATNFRQNYKIKKLQMEKYLQNKHL